MNTNILATRIMIFGDSISWGYQPGTAHARFDANVRWPGKLQDLLGSNYEIIEENLNSRGIDHGDPRPGKEGRRALDYIKPCLDSHDPLDAVIILLGTNELKHAMNMSADQIGENMRELLTVIKNRPSQIRDTKPKILLLSPPVINEKTDYCIKDNKYLYGTEKSKQLSSIYEKVASNLNIDFISLDHIEVGADGIHIDAIEHTKIAQLVFHYFNK